MLLYSQSKVSTSALRLLKKAFFKHNRSILRIYVQKSTTLLTRFLLEGIYSKSVAGFPTISNVITDLNSMYSLLRYQNVENDILMLESSSILVVVVGSHYNGAGRIPESSISLIDKKLVMSDRVNTVYYYAGVMYLFGKGRRIPEELWLLADPIDCWTTMVKRDIETCFLNGFGCPA